MSQGLSGDGKNAIFIVRMGKPQLAEGDDESLNSRGGRRIGYHTNPPLSEQELQDAVRMYWRADAKRARNVRYLVASHNRSVVSVYKVSDGDGVLQHHYPDNQKRIEFRVETLPEGTHEYSQIKELATSRLAEVRGRSPFVYADAHQQEP